MSKDRKMGRVISAEPVGRRTQADRRERTRSALLESAAKGLSRYGYGNLVLERVARDAGCTRGALYHHFHDKEDLALAVVAWVDETWQEEAGRSADREAEPVGALMALARAHAIYCRRDVARVIMTLRTEFTDPAHPIAIAIDQTVETLVKRFARLVAAGRRSGEIPPGPPARMLALALEGAIEGAVIQLAGRAPYDEVLAERIVLGVLGLGGSPPRLGE